MNGATVCVTATGLASEVRPFYSGEEPSGYCDFLPDGAEDCCDAAPAYAVWWHPVPALDVDTQPVSVSCEAHVMRVVRALVLRVTNDFGWRPDADGGTP